MGRPADARRLADEARERALEIGAVATGHGIARTIGTFALWDGEPERAATILRAAVEPELAAGYRDPGVLAGLQVLAEALVALDRLAEAEEALAPFEAAARNLDRPSALAAGHRARGLLATAVGDEPTASAAFAAALEQHARLAEPFERGLTLLAQGESHRRFRRRGQAREALEAAAAVFEALGATGWRERTTRELARTGHRESGDRLTPTERQVAELVAAGRTNREVAEILFMSPHTVEAHLTRIYRSLGVRGRTALARALPPAGDEPQDEGRG